LSQHQSSIEAAVAASITTWTRLEPSPRDASLQKSLQAQVRDPLWLLARQWQVGEFLGDDTGSPVHATLGAEMQTVSTYRPGKADSATVAIDPTLPIEVHVERETVALRLRGSVQHGLYFENLVRQGGVANPETVIAAFRAAFPIPAAVPDPTYATPDAARFRALTAGRVTDGEALYAAAVAVATGQTPATPLPAAAQNAGMPAILQAFTTFRASLFSEPQQDAAWDGQTLDYDFALGSPTAGQSLLANAPDFPGGHLDWYSFSLQTAQNAPVFTANPATVTPMSYDFLPNHVTFRGMPGARWWNFEDAITDFGQLDVETVDLAKLLVMEFALVYGNDWFAVPVPVTIGVGGAGPQGTLSRVTTLVVTDTFGVRTLIRPSETTEVNPDEAPWSMYKLAGDNTRSDFILMAPTLGVVSDAPALEQVVFLRDDMAAMAWAVERALQGDLDARVDAYQMYLQRLAANPAPKPPTATAGGPQVYYTLEVPPPDNWIPMVPVQTPQGALYLRRGIMESSSPAVNLKARALILEPQHPFFVVDRAVPRSGVQVERYFRYTRSSDGSYFLWLARKSGVGRGSGWSGLRFDTVTDMTAPAA
jgi:hypothetical protein